MPRPDGSINSDDWNWNDPPQGAGLPTLGIGGGVGYNPSRDTPFDRGMQAIGGGINSALSSIFPRGMAGQGNPIFWNTQAGAGVGAIPFTAQPQPNITLPNVRLMPQPNVYLPNVSLTPTGTVPNAPFTLPGATSYQGDPDRYYGGTVKFGGAGPTGGTGAGGGGSAGGGADGSQNGMSADERIWFGKASKAALVLGQDPAQFWNTTKIVYMNPNRNGSGNPNIALGRQVDDTVWGKAAYAAGILTGNADHDAIVWRDHYNAGGNLNADPMAGHNDAIDAYQAMQEQVKQALNPQADAYPDWYTAP